MIFSKKKDRPDTFDLCPPLRVICLSATPTRNGRYLRISLKKSEIEQLRKSRFRMRRVTSADSPYGRAFRNVADRKTGQSAEPLRNFASRLPAVS